MISRQSSLLATTRRIYLAINYDIGLKMVLYTLTTAMVEVLGQLQSIKRTAHATTSWSPDTINPKLADCEQQQRGKDDTNIKDIYLKAPEIEKEENSEAPVARQQVAGGPEPSLTCPKPGNPISHCQILDLWMATKSQHVSSTTLDALMRGSRIYIAPPEPKQEPTSEYKLLMARLRHEEDERSYQRMTNPPPPMETFSQRFPLSSAAHAFASAQRPLKGEDDDEVTYSDVDRQIALIFNVLISIVACAAAIWMAAKWWSTPTRLALSFSGSLLVGVAEVVVYLGYIRRVGEAKGREKGIKEVKHIMRTWVIGGPDGTDAYENSVPISAAPLNDIQPRRRRNEGKRNEDKEIQHQVHTS